MLIKWLVNSMLMLTIFIAITGCYTYSSLQNARIVDPGHFEVGFTYSSLSYNQEGESDHASSHIGLQFGYGISLKTNLRFRYEFMDIEGVGEDWHSLSFGPKFSLAKDQVALYVPLNGTFGKDLNSSDLWNIQPTLIFTAKINEYLEFNFAPKTMLYFTEDSDILIALNGGFGFSTDFDVWAIRPEIGFLFNPGEEGHYFSWNVGLAIYK